MLDQDGDGEIDMVVLAEETKEDITYDTLRDALYDLPLSHYYIKKHLIPRASYAEYYEKMGYKWSARYYLKKLRKTMVYYITNDIDIVPEEDSLRIIAMIDALIERLE